MGWYKKGHAGDLCPLHRHPGALSSLKWHEALPVGSSITPQRARDHNETTRVRGLSLQGSATSGTSVQDKRRVCIQLLLWDEGCWEARCPLHNVFLCSSVRERKPPLLNKGAVLLFQGRDTVLTFPCCLLVFKSATSMSSVLRLLDPTSPSLEHSARDTANSGCICQLQTILDVLHLTKTNRLCNSWDGRCAVGQRFNPLAVLDAPYIQRRVALYVAYQAHLGVNLGTRTQSTSAALGFHNPASLLFL